jgi:hypothetical protein
MKTPLLHPVFIAAVVLAAANQFLELAGIYLPFVHSYLDDLLCFPIILGTGLANYRLAYPEYRLANWHIWPLFVVVVFLFELYLPQTSSAYTADPLDVLFYLGGIYLFQKTINQPQKNVLKFAVK